MGEKLLSSVVAIFTGIIGVAIIAALISSKSNTASVISAGGTAFSSILSTALSPLTGAMSLGGITGGGSVSSLPIMNGYD